MTDWEQGAEEFEGKGRPGADWGLDDPINTILHDAATPLQTLSQLQAVTSEVAKLRRKLDRAEQLLTRLEAIPEQDPWGDEAVLKVTWRGPSGRSYDFILLRTKGLWYSTGRAGAPYRFKWAQLVDWFVKGRVETVLQMRGDRWISLVSLAEINSPVPEPHWCGRRSPHGPHEYAKPPNGIVYHCNGSVDRWCQLTNIHPVHVYDGDLPGLTYWCGGSPLTEREQCPRLVAHEPHVWNPVGIGGAVAGGDRNCHGVTNRKCMNVSVHPVHVWGPEDEGDVFLCQGV